MTFRSILVAGLAASIASAPTFAHQRPAGRAPLTIDSVMRGHALVGYEPRDARWSGDGRRVYFQWKRHDEPLEKDYDTYVVELGSPAAPRKLSEDEAREAPPSGGEKSRDGRFVVYSDEGDLFLYDLAASRRRRLTETSEPEADPHFTHDQRSVSFMRANNLFVMALDEGSVTQMTEIASGGAPQPAGGGPGGAPQARRGATTSDDKKGTASQEFLEKQERELLDVVRRRAAKREEEEAKRKRENPRKPFQLTPRQTVRRLQLAPDRKSVIALVEERDDAAKRSIVPNYVTESAYTEDIPSRTKVGDAQSRTRLVVLDVATGEARWVNGARDWGQGAGQTGTTQTTEPLKESPQTNAAQEGEPRKQDGAQTEGTAQQSGARQGRGSTSTEPAAPEPDFGLPIWSPDGTKAAVLSRSTDNKDRWVLALDPATAKTRVIFADHDDRWIGGPGMFTLGWLADSRTVYFQSERDGFSHLYTADWESGALRQLTSGRWEVWGTRLSDDRTTFYLTTNEAHPGERHLYAMAVTGGERRRLTHTPGNHQALPSPDGSALADIDSFANQPPELLVADIGSGLRNGLPRLSLRVTTSPAPDFSTYEWIEPPIVHVPARDGAKVPARIYKPKGYRKGGPAVIFVHGAGYLQNAHRWWSTYFREYMFHHLLMERGYLVLDVDYRGSAGYGRDWRTAIFENMGGPDLDDQVDAARWLVAEHGVDPARIGIYGGSYGGFITLMAMFKQPGIFAAGAALRPVTDWAHYNHPYTSNILELPQENLEVYKKTSPIYHAEGLRGALLICHGMVDVNVHFQDSVRLAQRLIELRKENWELAAYPVEDHSFVEPTSWADEYKRILKLFETNLKK